MKEVQFIRGSGQGNIYSTSRFGKVTLTASGNYGRVFAHIDPSTLFELSLSSIPIGSDIIALDACHDEHHIIGVTFIQTTTVGIEDVKTPYLNFYPVWTPSAERRDHSISQHSRSRSSDSRSSSSSSRMRNLSKENVHLRQLETIGQKCVQFKLNFIPYHLSHTRVKNAAGISETLFLLTGSDCRIHIYKPTPDTESFVQVPTQIYFPELYGIFPCVVTRLEIIKLDYPENRITLCGCEDGHLRSFILSNSGNISDKRSESPPVIYMKKSSSDSVFDDTNESSDSSDEMQKKPRARLADSLLSSNEDVQLGPNVQRVTTNFDGMITAIEPYWNESVLNIAVSSANSPVFVFTDVVSKLFQDGLCLKFSSRWDAVQSVCVADIDFDGNLEIVIGTFGCTVLVYKFMDEIGQWVITAHHKLPSAVFALEFIDCHLTVFTASGIHTLEYSDGTCSHNSIQETVQPPKSS